jgi:uncharacterized protein (UPF0128 family)
MPAWGYDAILAVIDGEASVVVADSERRSSHGPQDSNKPGEVKV